MKIGFLTRYRSINANAEYAHNLTAELIKQKHSVFILAPEEPLIPGETNSEFRFPKDSLPVESMVAFLKEHEINVLLIQMDGIEDLKGLETFCDQVNKFSACYAILHSDKYLQFNYSVFTKCLLPDRLIKKWPLGYRGIGYLNQGIPEYTPMTDEQRLDFRAKMALPNLDTKLIMAVSGKTNFEHLSKAVEVMNKTSKNELFLHTAKSGQEITDLVNKFDFVHGSIGYIDQSKLLHYMSCSDALYVNYPFDSSRTTSSLLRLGIASGTNVICNKGGHTFDLESYLPEMDDSIDLGAIIRRLTNTLINPAYRLQQRIRSRRAQLEISWDQTVKQLISQI